MLRRNLFVAMVSLPLLGIAGTTLAQGKADVRNPVGPDKVVYHINDSEAQAVDALRNVGNHLEVNPKVQIVVVTHARGVDFLFEGAKDKNGNSYNVRVDQLKTQGVRFEVCDITLRNRKLDRNKFISEATFVPSGVAEITRLQQREGYAYLRP